MYTNWFFLIGFNGSGINQLSSPHGLALDSTNGILFISDTDNHRIIKRILNSSNCSVTAGGNGPGISSNQLYGPRGIFFDAKSMSLFIANTKANNIVRWPLNGYSWTLVGGDPGGQVGSSSFQLNFPTSVLLDSMDNVYVSDEKNHRVQFFLAGQLNASTIAGVTGINGITAQSLYSPVGVVIDANLNLYVCEFVNVRVQKFNFML